MIKRLQALKKNPGNFSQLLLKFFNFDYLKNKKDAIFKGSWEGGNDHVDSYEANVTIFNFYLMFLRIAFDFSMNKCVLMPCLLPMQTMF